MKHNCIAIEERPTDYLFGAVIPYEVVRPDGSWFQYIDFNDHQKLSTYETDGCVLWAASQSIDDQVNQQIESGKIPADVVSKFDAMGYMETSPIDNGKRFHSSQRFLHILAGTKHNGTPLQKPWDVIRANGVLPYRDLPFDHPMTDAEYFCAIPQNLLDKAAQFLALIGGRDAVQYHWVVKALGNGTSITLMKTALKQAPICIGTAVCSPWNQINIPTCDSTNPEHSTMVYAMDTATRIEDSYAPFEKNLQFSYNIPYALQGIFKYIPPPPPAPVLPPNPTTPQVSSWLDSVKAWLMAILATLKGRQTFGSTSMNYSLLRSRTFYTLAAQFAYDTWQLLAPSASPIVSTVLNIVFLTLASYFHLQTGVSTTGSN